MDKFTDAEFYSLPRYGNGRIVDLPMKFLQLTDEQVEQLHGDDWAYYEELQEEVAYELHMMRMA